MYRALATVLIACGVLTGAPAFGASLQAPGTPDPAICTSPPPAQTSITITTPWTSASLAYCNVPENVSKGLMVVPVLRIDGSIVPLDPPVCVATAQGQSCVARLQDLAKFNAPGTHSLSVTSSALVTPDGGGDPVVAESAPVVIAVAAPAPPPDPEPPPPDPQEPPPAPYECTYMAPNSTVAEMRPEGSTIHGFNLLDPSSSADRQKQLDRRLQLMSWGWTVEWHFPYGIANRVLVIAMCKRLSSASTTPTSPPDDSQPPPPPPPPPPPSSSQDYAQNFDGLTDGSLHGQDQWTGFNASGQQNFVVQSAVVQQGGKAVQVAVSTHSTIDRTVGDLATGGLVGKYVSAWLRKTHASNSTSFFILRDGATGANRVFTRLGPDGTVGVYDGTTNTYVALSPYAPNTWVRVQVHTEAAQAGKFRARVLVGSTWSAWSPWLTVNGGSYTTLNMLRLDTDAVGDTTGHLAYYDAVLVSATDQ